MELGVSKEDSITTMGQGKGKASEEVSCVGQRVRTLQEIGLEKWTGTQHARQRSCR